MENIATTSNEILQTVSRSFALSIPMLDGNKMLEVENTYLLSRVVDTIEDSSLTVEKKTLLMDAFFKTLKGDGIGAFLQDLLGGIIDDHDKILTVEDNYRMILDTFNSLDEDARNIALEILREMSGGMVKYLSKEIRTFADLDEYCYFVAGTVGLYLNGLVRIRDKVHLSEEKAISLGRYLQKVNIIKNFRKDIEEGRNFWPSSLKGMDDMERLAAMIKSAKDESRNTFEYVASIPYELIGYRRFVLLSSLMAAENLRLMENNGDVFTSVAGVKIPRARMPAIFAMVEEAAHSNDALWRYKKELEGR
jgi:farnesyl-diphosphate farnesyltransferase